VARLLEVVELVGDPDPPVVALLLEQEVLELQSHHEFVAGCARPVELVPKNRARVVRPLFTLDRDVARESRERGLPGDRREAAQVWDRGDVGIARKLSDLARGEAG